MEQSSNDDEREGVDGDSRKRKADEVEQSAAEGEGGAASRPKLEGEYAGVETHQDAAHQHPPQHQLQLQHPPQHQLQLQQPQGHIPQEHLHPSHQDSAMAAAPQFGSTVPVPGASTQPHGILLPTSAAAAAAAAAAVVHASEHGNAGAVDPQGQFQAHLHQLHMTMGGYSSAVGGGSEVHDQQVPNSPGSADMVGHNRNKKYRKHTKTSFSIAEKAQVLRWIQEQEAAQPNQPITRNAVADYMQAAFPGTDRVSKPFVTLMRKQADHILEMANAEGPEAERLKSKRRSRSGDPQPSLPIVKTPTKQTRTHFTINQKIQVLDWIRNEESKEGVGQLTRNQIIEYMHAAFPGTDRVSRPFITLLRKQEDHLRQLAATNTPARNEMKRNRVSHVQKLDMVMVELMSELIQNHIPFTDDQLTNQAKRFQKVLNIPIGSYFRFSRDWLRRVKKQNGFVGAGSRLQNVLKDENNAMGAPSPNLDIGTIADRIALRHGASMTDFNRDAITMAAAAAAAAGGDGLAALAAGAEMDDASTVYESSDNGAAALVTAATATASSDPPTDDTAAATAPTPAPSPAPPAPAPAATNNPTPTPTHRPISNLSEACDAAADLHRFIMSHANQETFADTEPYMNIVSRNLQKIFVAGAVKQRNDQMDVMQV